MKQITYQKILIPYDGSHLAKCIVPHALAIISAFNPEILIINVIDSLFNINLKIAPVTSFSASGNFADTAQRVQLLEKKAAHHHVERLKKEFQVHGVVNVKSAILEGNPGDEIVKAAKHFKSDLILMSTHGRSGLRRVLLGSVTDYVIHHAGCPVLVVRPTKKLA